MDLRPLLPLCAMLLALGIAPAARAQSTPGADPRAPVSFALRSGGAVWAVLATLTAAPQGVDPNATFVADPSARLSLSTPLNLAGPERGFARARGVRAAAIDASGHRCAGRLDVPVHLGLIDDPDHVYVETAPATTDASWYIAARVVGCPAQRLRSGTVVVAFGTAVQTRAWTAREVTGPEALARWNALPRAATAHRDFIQAAPKDTAPTESVRLQSWQRDAGHVLQAVHWTATAGSVTRSDHVTVLGDTALSDDGMPVQMVLDLGDPASLLMVTRNDDGHLAITRLTGEQLIPVAESTDVMVVPSPGCG